jgi:hypothetical protein
VTRTAQGFRGFARASRRAPALALAASLSFVIAVACLINAGSALLRHSRVTVDELRDLRVYSTTAPKRVPRGTRAERRACRTAAAQAPPTVMTDDRKGDKLLDQRSVTLRDPLSQRILPGIPDEPAFAGYSGHGYTADVTLSEVNLAERMLALRVSIRQFNVTGKHKPRSFPPGTRLDLVVSGALGSTEFPIGSPLTQGATARASVTAPLSGSMAAYPHDAYFTALGPAKIRASIPRLGDAYYAIDLGHATRDAGVPTEVRTTQVPGIALAFPGNVGCTTRFGFIIERSAGQQFVWLMASVPLLLLLLVAHSLSEHWRARRSMNANQMGQSAFGAAAATQAGVAFLAILSLRAVLVPSEITTVTRVDYVLAAELALLVLCLAVGALAATHPASE